MLKIKAPIVAFLITVAFLVVFAIQCLIFLYYSPEYLATKEGFFVWAAEKIAAIDRFEYDARLRMRKEGVPHKDVAVVDINERTLEAVGQFPFPRGFYAGVVDKLREAGAKVVAFDIMFLEPERNEGKKALESLLQENAGIDARTRTRIQGKIQEMSGDRIFSEYLKQSPLPVVLGYTMTDSVQSEGDYPEEDHGRQSTGLRDINFNEFSQAHSYEGVLLPAPDYREAILANPRLSMGLVSADVDSDSVIRNAYLVIPFKYTLFSSLAVKALEAYKGGKYTVVPGDSFHLYLENEKDHSRIPLSRAGTFPLNYYGMGGAVNTYELIDVLQGKVGRKELDGRIVFLGVSAVGLKDIRASPLTKDFPGVEIHATLASNVLQNYFLLRDSTYLWFGLGLLVLGALVVSFLAFKANPILATALTLVLIAGANIVSQKLFFEQGKVVPGFFPSLEFAVLLFTGIIQRYLKTEGEKKYVRDAFSRYVSSTVVEDILKDKNKLQLGGQKRDLTVLFCDMVGFTKLSEHMDPSRLTMLLNQFFTRMTAIILNNQGTLDKYMGDAIMCFWGAPIELPNHAVLACKTALEMTKELILLNKEWNEKYGLTIGLRMGANSGDMSVGNMGSEQVFSYTVLGDNVNLGSRLEGVNNIYGTRIIVSETTKMKAEGEFLFRELDLVAVKGKELPVKIYELVGFKNEVSKNGPWIVSFNEGLEAYRAQDFEKARKAFQKTKELRGGHDEASDVFLERLDEMEKNPMPEAWDGVWKLTTK